MPSDGTKTNWNESSLPQWYNKNLVSGKDMQDYAALFDFNPQDTVLDLGCGEGSFLEIAAKTAAKAVGVDMSDTQLSITKDKLAAFKNTQLIKASFQDISFTQQELFTKVSIRKAIHHLTDEEKGVLINKVYGWLKPEGIFIIEDLITMFALNSKEQRRPLIEAECRTYYGEEKWKMMKEPFFTTLNEELPCDIAVMSALLLSAGFNIRRILNKNSLITTVIAQK